MAKKYTWGMYCGRLQHIHLGHQQIIDRMLDECEHGLILIGSAQEQGTLRNPFPYELRARLVGKIYPKATIKPLSDMTSERDITPVWGKYVLRHAIEVADGAVPNAMYYGNDQDRDGWFDPADVADIERVVFDRAVLPISATKMRAFLRDDAYEQWASFADPRIHPFYEELRTSLAKAEQI